MKIPLVTHTVKYQSLHGNVSKVCEIHSSVAHEDSM